MFPQAKHVKFLSLSFCSSKSRPLKLRSSHSCVHLGDSRIFLKVPVQFLKGRPLVSTLWFSSLAEKNHQYICLLLPKLGFQHCNPRGVPPLWWKKASKPHRKPQHNSFAKCGRSAIFVVAGKKNEDNFKSKSICFQSWQHSCVTNSTCADMCRHGSIA